MNVLSLLQRITPNQIDDLITEAELSSSGFRFFYALDNHEIHKYCFPGDLNWKGFEIKSNGEVNVELETDIATAFDDFFTQISPNNPVFFLNEYVAELVGLRTKIQEAKNADVALPNYVYTFNDYLSKMAENKQKVIEDATLFIAIATGALKDGLARFNSIIGHQAFITKEERFKNIAHDQQIFADVFLSPYRPRLEVVEKIFDAFVQHRFIKRRYSKRIDSEAIARMLYINERLLEKHADSKILLFFLSSASGSTNVFETIRSNQMLPYIYDRQFNFHRTVDQLFLNRLMGDLPTEERIERLQNIKKFIELEYLESAANTHDHHYMTSYDVIRSGLEEQFQKMREHYVNTHLTRKDQFEKISQLSSALEKASITLQMSAVRKLFARLKSVAEKYEDESSNLKELNTLETSFQIGQVFYASFNKAIFLLERGKAITISRGQDVIVGRGHHLPIVFRYGANMPNNQFDKIAELFLNQFAFLLQELPKEEIINTLTSLVASMGTDFSSGALQDRLLICLYALVLPDIDPTMTNSAMVEEFLSKIEDLDKTSPLYSDYLYVLAWVQRRNRHYKQAMETCELGLRLFSNDPRFFHGRFLINTCLEDNLITTKELIFSYRSQIDDIRKAKQLYEPILASKPEAIRLNTIATLVNSELFVHLLLIEKCYTDDTLIKEELKSLRREYLVPLKIMCGEYYKEYPEFGNTEAFLEKLECELETDIQKRDYRLKCAIETLTHSIQIAKTLDSMRTDSYEELLKQLKNAQNDVESYEQK